MHSVHDRSVYAPEMDEQGNSLGFRTYIYTCSYVDILKFVDSSRSILC